jgi:hypothetical protein
MFPSKSWPMVFARVFPYNNHTTTIQQLYNNPYNNPYNNSYSLGKTYFGVCAYKENILDIIFLLKKQTSPK